MEKIKSGLVSVSFRSLSPEPVVIATKAAGLEGIEWGGDIHVPPGDIRAGSRVKALTESAGLAVIAYGSYYKAGTYKENYLSAFLPVLETAEALGAPIIRIWAHNRPSEDIKKGDFIKIAREIKHISSLAQEKGISVALECHNNTITDDFNSSLRLLEASSSPNLFMYWQPNQYKDFKYNLSAAKALAPYTICVHAFNWSGQDKHPLCEGLEEWREYANALSLSPYLCAFELEFMPDGDVKSLTGEAKALYEIMRIN